MLATDCVDPTEQLINQIDAYLIDRSHNYAIALEGEWGSGKTRFLEGKLATHLKKNGIDLVRASMFGVLSADDLYERIAMALIHLGNSAKTEGLAEVGKSAVAGAVTKMAEKIGLTLNITASMQAIVGLTFGDNRLLVLDDVERRSKKSDDLALFGAVNDLVEGMGAKILLVSNSLSDNGSRPVREFDKNVREKLVWKTYRFEPGPVTLARDILTADLASEDSDILNAIIAGARASECSNARAMIRAEGLIHELCNLNTLRDEKIALQNRLYALRDAVHFALLVCMGREPKRPKRAEGSGPITAETLACIAEEEFYDRYSSFPAISLSLNPSRQLSQEELDKNFREYISKHYPHNESTIALQNIYDKLAQFDILEDGDVEQLANQFQQELAKASFSAEALRNVINIYSILKRLGFAPNIDEKFLLNSCKKVVEEDPSGALRALDESAFIHWSADDPRTTVIKQLVKWAEYLQPHQILESLDIHEKTTGIELAAHLEELLNEGNFRTLSEISPIFIAEAFLGSSPDGQKQLRIFFRRLTHFLIPSEVETGPLTEWVGEIKKRINITEVSSRLGSLRKAWMINDLAELLEHLRSSTT